LALFSAQGTLGFMPAGQSLEVGQVELVLTDLKLSVGLTINAVTLTGNGVTVRSDPVSVLTPVPGALEALILGPNLADFLDRQAPGGLKNFQVELRDGKIFVQANVMIMKASAVCTLRIQDRRQLFVDLESVDVLGIGAKNMVQGHLDKINPVLDVAELPFDVELTGYEIEDGKLVLRGNVAAKAS
jgi:hypothetical protein